MTREQIYKAALERIEALQCTQPAVCDNHAALIAREALAAIRSAQVETRRRMTDDERFEAEGELVERHPITKQPAAPVETTLEESACQKENIAVLNRSSSGKRTGVQRNASGSAPVATDTGHIVSAAPVERPRYCPTCGAIGRQRLSKGSVCSDAFHGLQTAPVEALADDVEYRDIDGNVVSLFKLCATNPEWAASMIKRDRAGRK